jgi:hypothetical protein
MGKSLVMPLLVSLSMIGNLQPLLHGDGTAGPLLLLVERPFSGNYGRADASSPG